MVAECGNGDSCMTLIHRTVQAGVRITCIAKRMSGTVKGETA